MRVAMPPGSDEIVHVPREVLSRGSAGMMESQRSQSRKNNNRATHPNHLASQKAPEFAFIFMVLIVEDYTIAAPLPDLPDRLKARTSRTSAIAAL
jgi:hypothetical protein